MERLELAQTFKGDHIPVALLALLPSAMILLDGLTGADQNAALWTTPMPVSIALIGVVLWAVATKAPWRETVRGVAPKIGLGLFGLAIALGTANGVQPIYALIKLGDIALAGALCLAFAGVILRQGTDYARQLILAFIFGVAISLPLVALSQTTDWPAGLGKLDMPGYIHIRIFGFSMALAIVAGAGIWGDLARSLHLLMFTTLVALATALFWSGGRGALMSLLALPLLAVVIPKLRPGLLPALAAVALGLGLSLLLPQDAAEFGLADRLVTDSSVSGLTSGRTEMWRALLVALMEHPLGGYGYAQTHWIFIDGGFSVAHLHAHNIVLDGALALGLPGMMVALGLSAFVWVRWIMRATSALAATGVAIVTSFLLLGLVDGIYFYYQGLIPLSLGIALIVSSNDQGRESLPKTS